MPLLEGKVAIVTGAGHGIGRGHAMELAKHGAPVVVNDLGGSERARGAGSAAEDTVKLITTAAASRSPNFADVSDYESRARWCSRPSTTFGKLDILVNNAGIVRDAAIWNMKVEDWDAVMRVHVRGTWSTVAPRRRSTGASAPRQGGIEGRIVNTTSGAGLGGNFGQTNYATAKAAIVGMTLTLAQELYKPGVTANCIGPAGLTRITATMPGSDPALEPDDGARRRVEPDGPEELVAGRGVARERRRRLRDRSGHPGDPRQDVPDAGLVRRRVDLVGRQAVGRGAAQRRSWPPSCSAPATPACASKPPLPDPPPQPTCVNRPRYTWRIDAGCGDACAGQSNRPFGCTRARSRWVRMPAVAAQTAGIALTPFIAVQ